MNNRIFLALSVSLVLTFALFSFGFYLYNNVLPYQFSNQWEPTEQNLNLSGEYDSSSEIGEFMGQKVISSNFSKEEEHLATNTNVLGDEDEDSSEKHIEVDLSKQMVYAYEGDKKVMEFLVSSGKWGRTPTGEFTIAYKTKSQTMSGGSKALHTYYYLPNVKYVQFFGNKDIPWSKGFSFHGTYWHNNFGHPMSHGCLNMRNEDAKKLFEWTNPELAGKGTIKAGKDNPGTKVKIFGTAPKS